MEPGDYQHGRFKWKAGKVSTNNGCSTPCTYDFPSQFSMAPGMLFTIHDTNNSGATWVRSLRITPAQVQFRMDATTEDVFYVAFEEER
jgi:hypothetical protein